MSAHGPRTFDDLDPVHTPAARDDDAGIRSLVRPLRTRWRLFVVCLVLVPMAAVAVSFTQTKRYTATASLLFRDPGFDQKLFGSTYLAPSRDPDREAATNVRLVSLPVVGQRTARELGRGLTESQVSEKVTVAGEGQSDVVSVTATNTDPEFAAKLANTFAAVYIDYRRAADRAKIREAQGLVARQLDQLPADERAGARGRELRERSEQLEILASLQTGNAELAQPARTPSSPSSPKPIRNAVLGTLLGLLLGLIVVFVVDRLDRRIRDTREIEELFGRPVLAAICDSRRLSSVRDPRDISGVDADAFRMLHTNLRYFNVDHDVSSVIVTSAAPGDGKTTVSWNLAAVAAASGSRTLLIEADLRRPSLGRVLQPWARPVGLSQVLAGESSLAEATVAVPVSAGIAKDHAPAEMDVLFAGALPPNPSDLMQSEKMRQLLRDAKATYDLVVLDTPPAAVVPDPIPLLTQVSGVIVVTRLGGSVRDAAILLRKQLENVGATTIGVVVNRVGRDGQKHYAYGYGREYAQTPSSNPSSNGELEKAPVGR